MIRRSRPDALMYVTVAFLWVSVWRFQDLWPIIGKLQLPILCEFSLAILVAMKLTTSRDTQWLKSRVFTIPFLLLAVMIAGLPLSLLRGYSLTFVTKVFMPILLLMTGVALSIRNAEDANWIALAHLVGADIYSLYTYLFAAIGSDGRISGSSHYDANDLGVMIVATLPLAIYFLRPGVSIAKRLFALASLMLFIQLIIKSGSRGGFIALICIAIYIVFAFRAIPARVRIGAVVVAALVMAVFGSAAYWTMMHSLTDTKDDYNMTSPIGRKAIWKRGVGYMLTHPIIGTGASTFEAAEGSLSEISREYAAEGRGLKWSTAHNTFVLVGAELGVTGLMLFVTMIGTAIKHLSEIRDGPNGDPDATPDDTAFAQSLIGCLIGYCVAGFFVSAAYFAVPYVLIGLVVAEDGILGRRRVAKKASVAVPSTIPSKQIRSVAAAPRAHWLPAGNVRT